MTLTLTLHLYPTDNGSTSGDSLSEQNRGRAAKEARAEMTLLDFIVEQLTKTVTGLEDKV